MKTYRLWLLLATLLSSLALSQPYVPGGGGVTQLIAGTNITLNPSGGTGAVTITASSTAATAFSALTSSTNTTAAMVVGTGASLSAIGSGGITATAAPLSGITGFGTGVETFLATPTAANLGAAVTGAAIVAGTNVTVSGTWPNQTINSSSASTGANPTATAGPTAVNGSATTFMRSDGAPAVQKASSAQFGIVETDASTISNASGVISCTTGTTSQLGCLKPDGTSITVSAGVITASGGSATTITPGTTTVSGATAPCLIDNSTSTTMGCAALGSSLALTSGTLNTTAPNRTVTSSPTVLSTDMGGQVNSNVSGGGTLTIPAISSTVFASGQTLTVVNYSASTEAVSTTPTVNSGGGCVSGTGIPAGDTWNLTSNGTSIDCNQTVSSASGGGTPGGSSGNIQYNNSGAFGGIAVTAGQILQGGTTPTGTATPTLGASGTLGTLTMGNATSGTLTLAPVTGALGSVTASFPANTGTVDELNLAQTFTAVKTFTNSDLCLLGSSTGCTTFTSANASATNYTLTVPAATDTMVTLAATQTLTNKTLTSPTLTTPALGTPASGVMTNLTGTPSSIGLANGTGLPLAGLATQAANTVVMNATGGSASPTAVATVSYLIDAGTTFTLGSGTGACATTSTLTGGTAVGSFKCTGTTGTSTQVVTLPTTTNGWVCDFHDITTTTDTEVLSASSTTSATMSGTVAANDVILFKCAGY